ncbi:MAG: hypothetical protein ACRD4Q_09275 [Candidatus Acidiferrales bacterium]
MLHASTANKRFTNGEARHPSEIKRYRFLPTDDRLLLGTSSFEDLQSAMRTIAEEANYPLHAVVRRAKSLGIWGKLACPRRQFTIREKTEVRRLLSRCNTKTELLSEVAAALHVERERALRLLYRDSMLKESLAEGTYTLREVAQGLCMRPASIKQLIDQGFLRARQLQPLGKIFITSDSISSFVTTYPRRIDWERCMAKSPWLRDILESARIKELSDLLCVSERKIQSWIRMGFLKLAFAEGRIGDLFGDESIYRFLDEYPQLVDFGECSAKSPGWFTRYERVRGRYPKKAEAGESGRDAGSEPHHYFALRHRR